MFSFLRNAKTLLAWSESGSNVVAWNRWRLGFTVLYVGQEVRLRTSGEKEPSRYSPLSALCGAWLVKKLCSDYEAGVSP
jgi:hypothetical protein